MAGTNRAWLSKSPVLIVGLLLAVIVYVAQSCHGGQSTLPLGHRCSSSEECEGSALCVYGRCRSECQRDADCEGDEICIASEQEGLMVCTVPSDWSCVVPGPGCPAVLVCVSEGECQEVCDSSDDCLPDGVCVDHRCEPADGDGDGDADSDGDTDADSDVDADADSDIDADAQFDGDVDAPAFDCFPTDGPCGVGEACCFDEERVGLYCSPTGECSGTPQVFCHSIEDCAAGEACCDLGDVIRCDASCDPTRRLCLDHSDCDPSAGTPCCDTSYPSDFGRCYYPAEC